MLRFCLAQLKDYRLVVKYVVSGSIAATVQLSALVFLVEQFFWNYIEAVLVAFFISASVAFFLQKFWTFRDKSMHQAHFQVSSYLLLAATSLFLNVILMLLFIKIFHFWYFIAQMITIVFVTMFTFLCNKYMIFNRESLIFTDKKDK